jgi:hypothetical protein
LFRYGSERPKKAAADTAKASETEKYEKSIDNCPKKRCFKTFATLLFYI